MATKTPTPIEALERAVKTVEDAQNRMHPYVVAGNTTVADARTALEDVEALAALMQRIGHDEELSYLACPGPPNCDGSHYDTCPVALARTAVAKFQEARRD